MPGSLSKEQEVMIIEALRRALAHENMTLRIGSDVRVRINGIQEGELFLALRCKVFVKKDQ